MKKTLVVYYTHSQNTAKMAQLIAREMKADIVEIVPEMEYPQDYNTVVEQAKREIRANYRPKIKNKVDIKAYDIIFVGTPNWWSTVAPPIATFLESHDFAGKIVVPFATHGGGGFGHIEKDVKNLASNAEVKEGTCIYGSSSSKSEITSWLKFIDLI